MKRSQTLHARTTDRPASLLPGNHPAGRLFALLVLVASTAACSGPPDATTPGPEARQPVRVATVDSSQPPARLRLPGVVRAIERADLAFLHSGRLAERLVQRGQPVAAGQALAILHNPALMPGVSAAEARVRELGEQLQQLERETQRLTELHQRGLVATDDLDQVRSRRNATRQARSQAQAGLKEAREQLAEATLRAPFAGRVVALPVEPGQFVGAGQAIISISAPEHLELAVDLSVRQARALAPGQPATLRRIEGGPQTTGKVREIGLPAPGRPAAAIIDLPDAAWPEWSPGQAVHVEFSFGGDEKLSIPLDALIDTGDGLPHVFRVRDGHAELVNVTPGELDGGRVRVDGPLKPGDEVITAGHGQLLDGEPVRVLR